MRIVLLKGFDQDGFVFFTNYESEKGNSWRPIRTPRWRFTGSNLTDKFALAEKRKKPRATNRKPIFIRVLSAAS